MNDLLPELRSGDVIVSVTGRKAIVRRVKNRACDLYDEPIYRLTYILDTGKELCGHSRWTLDELNKAGARMA